MWELNDCAIQNNVTFMAVFFKFYFTSYFDAYDRIQAQKGKGLCVGDREKGGEGDGGSDGGGGGEALDKGELHVTWRGLGR